MSLIQNEEWLEAARENFEEAVEGGNIVLAKDIIQDTFDAGFSDAARQMNEELRKATDKEDNVQ